MRGALICLCLFASASTLAAQDELVLAKEGKTRYQIVLANDAIPPERRAAEELQKFIKEMSGAEIPIVAEKDLRFRPAIYLNARDRMARLDADFAGQSPVRDGFRIRTRKRDVLIVADRPRGTLAAVYTLLEDHLGCRWFTPSVSRIPKRDPLVLPPLDLAFDPPLEYREDFYLNTVEVKTDPEGDRTGLAYFFKVRFDGDWSSRNRMNGNSSGLTEIHGGGVRYHPFCHTMGFLIPEQVHFKEHPEYFAEVDGKRVGGHHTQPCLTNPEVLRLAIEGVRTWIKNNPWARIISVTQNDNMTYCRCKDCRAIDEAEGSPAGTMITFANKIAEAIEGDHPEIIIDTFAYQYTRKPPKTVRPRPNVCVRLCSIECCFLHPLETCPHNASFREDIMNWSKICDRLYVWDYVTDFPHYLLPFPNLEVLEPNIRFFVKHNVKGIFEEGNYHSRGEMSELRAYMLAKGLWNPQANLRKAREEFIDAYYGPAAEAIRHYLEFLHGRALAAEGFHMTIWTNPDAPYLQGDFLGAANRLFDRAEKLAAGKTEFLERVRAARIPVRYVEVARTAAGPGRKTAADKFMEEMKRVGIRNVSEPHSVESWYKVFVGQK